MVMEMEKDRISINQSLGVEKNIFQVENDIIVNDIKPDVLSIIDTNGVLCVNKKEVIDGKIRLEGEVNTYIIYLADDENSTVRSLNTVLNFNEAIELKDYNENMDVCISCKLKDIESKIINGRKINLKALIEVQSKLYLDSNIDIVNNIDSLENMQVLKTNEQIVSCIGKGTTKVNAKDTISINEADDVAEIMKVNFNVIDKEIKISYNKVLVKADADVMVLYLTEDNRVNSVHTKIPVMGFIDMQDISDDCFCTVNDQLSNLIIKCNNDEHSIYVEAEIEFLIEAFQKKQIDIVEDLYSTVADAHANQKNVNAMVGKENIKYECKINESIQNKDLENATIYWFEIEPNIIKEDIRNGKVLYEGEAIVKVLCSKDGKMAVNTINIPFNSEIESDLINSNSLISKDISVKNENIILQGDRINISMCLEFNIIIEESKELNLIEEINMDEINEKNPYSMVIYFVKPGDTLWKIAKKFRSTIEDIVRINDIEDENKINIGKQLYIPKPVSSNG